MRCLNNSGEIIPPNSAIESYDYNDSSKVFRVRKPSANDIRNVFISPNHDVPEGAEFEGYDVNDAWVALKEGTINSGDNIGVEANEWTMNTDNIGFICVADIENELVNIRTFGSPKVNGTAEGLWDSSGLYLVNNDIIDTYDGLNYIHDRDYLDETHADISSMSNQIISLRIRSMQSEDRSTLRSGLHNNSTGKTDYYWNIKSRIYTVIQIQLSNGWESEPINYQDDNFTSKELEFFGKETSSNNQIIEPRSEISTRGMTVNIQLPEFTEQEMIDGVRISGWKMTGLGNDFEIKTGSYLYINKTTNLNVESEAYWMWSVYPTVAYFTPEGKPLILPFL